MARFVSIFLLLVIFSLPACSFREAPKTAVEGQLAPDFILADVSGTKTRLSDLKGVVVLVNFWATWCPPCRAELPAFEQVYRSQRDKGLVVVGVDVAESPDEVAKFVVEAGLTFPIALDASGETTELYRIQGMPTTFFVGRDGLIKDMVIGGPLTQAAIESRVAELMK